MKFVDTIIDQENGKIRLFRLDPFSKYLDFIFLQEFQIFSE